MKALARLHLSALGVVLTLTATPAYAQAEGMLDNVLNKYKSMAAAWASVFTTHATILFGTLAAASLIWTFGAMALRRADLGEFAAEAIRFAIFCGFFWWLLINGPAIGIAIIEGLRSLGAQASGLPNNLAPSGIVDIGFDIFEKALAKTSIVHPIDSLFANLVALGILIVLALVGVNMLLLLASGYILAYAGVIFLGFGGGRWTSDIALNYFKTVVAVGASLMTMVLIVGVGKTFLDQYYNSVGDGVAVQDLGTMLVFAVVLLALVNKVPAMVGGVISGGSIHAAGGIGAFGAGAALGAAGMAAGAAATGGAMIAAGAMNAAGGASAIKAAFAAAGGSGGEGGQTGMGGGQPLSSAGDMPGGGDNGGGGGGGGGTPLSVAMGGDGGSPPANDNSGLQGGSEAASAGGGTAASAAAGSEAADREDGGGAAGGSPAGEGEASSASSQGEGAPESGETGGTQRTGLSRAAKTASILGGAAAGMAVGALKERVGNTVGGRLAANIRASAASASSGSETLAPATGAGSPASSSDSSPPPTAQFAGDTISAARDAGDMETPEDEVAAFVQRRGDS